MVGSLAFLQVESPAQWYSFGLPAVRAKPRGALRADDPASMPRRAIHFPARCASAASGTRKKASTKSMMRGNRAREQPANCGPIGTSTAKGGLQVSGLRPYK